MTDIATRTKYQYLLIIKKISITFGLLFLSVINGALASNLDVLSYDVTIEPIIEKKYVKGNVVIRYKVPSDEHSFELHSGNLQVDAVTGSSIKKISTVNDKLIIELIEERGEINEISIQYSGYPNKGLFFNQQKNQAFTVYFTDHWMVSNFVIGDKATISLDILIDKELICISNGELREVKEKGGKMIYSWHQSFESPAYTFGFVVGKFNKFVDSNNDVKIINYAQNHSSKELEKIFIETSNIISFFEDKTGIKYGSPHYFQVLIGNNYQEMSGLSVLKESYGLMVLKDNTEINLITHEIAHQWWGNRITSESLSHFWLNEAMATYMSAAYNKHRFGDIKYKADIDSYFQVYQEIKNRHKDKALVFKDWLNPSKDDRNIIYFKGAYVLHLLRLEVGDKKFWDAIKYYSQKYYDKSVSTLDFKEAVEKIAEKNLDDFFNEWVFNSDQIVH